MHGTLARGLEDVAKAEEALVEKQQRPRQGPSELDLVAMAALYLQEQGLSRRQAMREAKIAIARGGLNAPYSLGGA